MKGARCRGRSLRRLRADTGGSAGRACLSWTRRPAKTFTDGLSGLVILLEHRMKSEAANLICHFAGVGEYGLALEELAGYLALAGTPITGQERNDLMALAAKMPMDDNVPLTLAFCPHVI